jgi:alkylated DNA repair dioxygenase AlkB
MINYEINKCNCKGIRVCKNCENYKNVIRKCVNLEVDLTNYLIVHESNIFLNDIDDKQLILKRFYTDINSNSEININMENTNPFKYITNLTSELNSSKIKTADQLNLDNNGIIFDDNLFNGFFIINNFLNNEEASKIIMEMKNYEWRDSQSGRKKQDYGPLINYKKRRVKNLDLDVKFPDYYYKLIKDKLNKINNEEINLENFTTAEMGNLFYSPLNGSCIDPHIDDIWIWGRIVGINLLSACIITFSKEINIPSDDGNSKLILFEIDIPIKENDLYLMTNTSRYLWKHSIKRNNIISDRIVITLREYEHEFKIKNF